MVGLAWTALKKLGFFSTALYLGQRLVRFSEILAIYFFALHVRLILKAKTADEAPKKKALALPSNLPKIGV